MDCRSPDEFDYETLEHRGGRRRISRKTAAIQGYWHGYAKPRNILFSLLRCVATDKNGVRAEIVWGGIVGSVEFKLKKRHNKAVLGALTQSRAPARVRENRPAVSESRPTPREWKRPTQTQIATAIIVLAALLWSYWPTLVQTVSTWDREPDYSHGFLVAPIAIAFLWLRRREFPGGELRGSRWGWMFIATAFAVRIAVSLVYIEAVDGWTIPLWLAGVVLLVGGWPVLRWCGPSIAFLWFMFPIPYSAEYLLSQPLQSTATWLSTAALQILWQPAIAEGNVILLGENTLEVEQACSGLRIFVGIFALAFAYVLFARKTWWENLLLLASAVPIALVANSARIVATALLQRYVSSEASKQFTHDFSGWVMIPLAAALFWVFLVYISRLFREVEVVDVGQMSRRELRPNVSV